MELVRTGIILNVEKFDECVAFYRSLFGLRTLFEKEDREFRLTCLEFGGSYLMIETGGVAVPAGKTPAENAAKLRFHVADIDAARKTLHSRGIAAEVTESAWGSTIDIHDPDGNRIGIRDDGTFARQVESGRGNPPGAA